MDEGIVTGEGVLLDTRPTSFVSRALAALIDLAVLGIVLLAAALALGGTSFTPSEAFSRILSIALLATILVIAPTTVDTLTRGRSLGKLIVGIRVVRDDGGPVRLRQAFVRALTGVFELWLTLGSVALICAIVQPQGKRVGDLLAGTYAVRVRGKTAARAPVMMPPHLAEWAAGADVRRLPDGLALSVRQFLARTGTLHPQSRASLGTELAVEVQRYVAPAPPPGTHPEVFLAAVLAERRRREHLSAEASRQRAAQESALMQRLPHGVPDPVD
ncbi:RDD family protein [Cellulomonas chengniuliangii]|uniref:RDD family protein n=1 Tax=Cellulomonas chengniuliangii TaxID=2968084 RepID=A0ABY5KVL1_9CELL|nr:RDD family protein [Cellulomonas chengniuliangii]MCC2308772.1 RDD family protein [Cellulomonas chengniuliangii]UUI74479.1 RDD family protein [Cellulomonas chengniuliangii]